jgi:PAS domain-containing protein
VAWDREAYRRDVLEPARQAGNVPPADLYQRYGLAGQAAEAGDEDAVAGQLARVVAYWRELRSDLVLRTLAGRLLVAHDELERDGPLSADRLGQLHEQYLKQLRDRLADYAKALASEQTVAGPDTVAKLVSVLGGSVTNADVEAALQGAGVRVVDAFPALPATPHPQQRALLPYLDDLGLQLSAEIIFGEDVRRGFRVLDGFRLSDGRRLNQAALVGAKLAADRQAFADLAKDRVQKALTSMSRAAGTPGGLDALLLSEVVERLRQLIRLGLSGPHCLATRAIELGLVRDEANLLAAALRAEDTTEAVRAQVEEMLSAGQLRAAQRLAAGLATGDPLRARVAEVDATVAGLSRAAAAAAAQGEIEQAAERLAEALGLARDDDVLADRLAALPPPAPAAARVQLAGQQVLVSWEASPARAGRMRYRVLRGLGRAPVSATDGTVVVTDTEARSVTDQDAPAGAEVCYSVFAERGGAVYSAPASTELLPFAPDVTDVDVAEAEFSVTVSWQAHPGAEGIDVVRWTPGPGQEGGEPAAADGTAVAASMRGFTDDGLRTGTQYRYRITAVYRAPDGARRLSAGIVVPAVPTPEPGAVSDLTVALATDEVPAHEVPADGAAASTAPVVLSWTPPRHGQVRLVRAGHAPGWLAGARVTPDPDTLTDIPGQPEHDVDGRAVLRARLPFGRHFITALTELGRLAVAGNTVPLLLLEPARDAHGVRRHDTVELSWVWPRDATDVIVRHPGGELDCSRRAYFDEGGCTISVDRHAATFSIIAVHQGPDGRQAAPPTLLSVPAREAAVQYHIRRSRLHPRQRVIEVSAEEDIQLPPLVTVQTTGRLPPTGPAGGARIHETGRQPAGPGQLVPFTVQLAHRDPSWVACFVDPRRSDPEADPILLFHPPQDEMRVP